ncbi:hypothetical protein MHYP_G00165450 [Metynnis hypsauchen]
MLQSAHYCDKWSATNQAAVRRRATAAIFYQSHQEGASHRSILKSQQTGVLRAIPGGSPMAAALFMSSRLPW